MATTANGLPYPVGTDKVVDGDDAIRALAEAVDSKLLATGNVRGGRVVGTTDVNGIVVYPHGQTWTPTWVVATIDAGGTAAGVVTIVSVLVQYTDPTYIALRFRREDTGAWLASNPVAAFVSFGR